MTVAKNGKLNVVQLMMLMQNKSLIPRKNVKEILNQEPFMLVALKMMMVMKLIGSFALQIKQHSHLWH